MSETQTQNKRRGRPTLANPMKLTAIRFHPDQLAALEVIADVEGVNLSTVVRAAIDHYLAS